MSQREKVLAMNLDNEVNGVVTPVDGLIGQIIGNLPVDFLLLPGSMADKEKRKHEEERLRRERQRIEQQKKKKPAEKKRRPTDHRSDREKYWDHRSRRDY